MAKMFQVYGIGQALIPVLPPPLPFGSAPTSNQTNYEIGQIAYTPPTSPTAFFIYAGAGNWIEFSTDSGAILAVNGTANQITATTVAGVVTLSIPSTFIAPGSVEVTTTFTVDGITANICNSNTASTVTMTDGTGANTTNISNGASGAANVVNISSGNTTASTKTVNILSGTNLGGTDTLNLGVGSGPKIITVGGDGTDTITVGTNAVTTLTIGGTTTTSTTTIQSGTGGISLNAPSATANHSVTIQGTAFSAGSQSMVIESGNLSGGTQQVAIMNGAITGGTQFLSLANGSKSAGAITVSVLSGDVTGSGSASLMLGAGTGPKTVGLGNGTGVTTITIGNTTASTTVDIKAPVSVNVTGNLNFAVAGNKIMTANIATTTTAGANSFGTVTLSGGTATVSTTAVTASSKIVLTRQTVGATGAAALGELSIGTISAGTSFVINAWQQANATALATTDVSNILWMLIN